MINKYQYIFRCRENGTKNQEVEEGHAQYSDEEEAQSEEANGNNEYTDAEREEYQKALAEGEREHNEPAKKKQKKPHVPVQESDPTPVFTDNLSKLKWKHKLLRDKCYWTVSDIFFVNLFLV
jgi:hypothetical protein